MDWNQLKSKFNLKMSKEKWIMILVVGAILMILSYPDGKKKTQTPSAQEQLAINQQLEADRGQREYEEYLEARVKEILGQVEGVGQVDVMVVLKSSEEKVFRIDRSVSSSSTNEQDSGGGMRSVESHEESEATVMQNSSGTSQPIVTKELKPAIAGIIISATGGGSPTIKAEISSAMEALFDVPPHKIKVLKRVE